jgi:hypothetical protein
MAKPHQLDDQDRSVSGFFTMGAHYALTDSASVVFDADEATAIVFTATAGCTFSIGVTPTSGSHVCPAGVLYPVWIPAGEKIYIETKK